jgi:hypothetical protein
MLLLAVLFFDFYFLIEYGGLPVIQHFVLRFVLYRNGYLPWQRAILMYLQTVSDKKRNAHQVDLSKEKMLADIIKSFPWVL